MLVKLATVDSLAATELVDDAREVSPSALKAIAVRVTGTMTHSLAELILWSLWAAAYLRHIGPLEVLVLFILIASATDLPFDERLHRMGYSEVPATRTAIALKVFRIGPEASCQGKQDTCSPLLHSLCGCLLANVDSPR